jgi:hypothetical protein
MSHSSPPPLDGDDWYGYSAEDFEDILADVFVEYREFMDDEDAARAVDIAYRTLTDDFYAHDDE